MASPKAPASRRNHQQHRGRRLGHAALRGRGSRAATVDDEFVEAGRSCQLHEQFAASKLGVVVGDGGNAGRVSRLQGGALIEQVAVEAVRSKLLARIGGGQRVSGAAHGKQAGKHADDHLHG